MKLLSLQTQHHVTTFCDFHPIHSYSITLCSSAQPQSSWPAALGQAAAASLALSGMKKVYSLNKPQAHMVQHLICFKLLESQVENSFLSHMPGSQGVEFSRTSLLPAFEGSSLAFDVALSKEVASSHGVLPSQDLY